MTVVIQNIYCLHHCALKIQSSIRVLGVRACYSTRDLFVVWCDIWLIDKQAKAKADKKEAQGEEIIKEKQNELRITIEKYASDPEALNRKLVDLSFEISKHAMDAYKSGRADATQPGKANNNVRSSVWGLFFCRSVYTGLEMKNAEKMWPEMIESVSRLQRSQSVNIADMSWACAVYDPWKC